MDTMNVFQHCWKNWTRHPFGQPNPDEHVWINELNQAIFTKLEKILSTNVMVRAVSTPSFFYRTRNVARKIDMQSACVSTYHIKLPKDGSFETRVDVAVNQLLQLMKGSKTVFIYTPVVPVCEKDLDGSVNRHMMGVRLTTTEKSIDENEAQ
jgi:hypothetical protein